MSGSLARRGYELELEDQFDRAELDTGRWLPYYLPHWSTWEQSAARYETGAGTLRLQITSDQPSWCPELDGPLRVSSLQTGLFAGPPGSSLGQHRFNPRAVVRTGPEDRRLYTPQYGLFEVRARAIPDPRCMVAFWMIGFEDRPERSAEICICEIFGKNVGPDQAGIGVGIHPHGDPQIIDDFSVVTLPIDAREFHVYQAEWTRDQISFAIDGTPVKTVNQSPDYPMQLMLNIYEFAADPATAAGADEYPKEFVVDYVRGYRPRP